jgi:hypothetical protein
VAAGCHGRGDGGAEGLAGRNDYFRVDIFCPCEVFVGPFGITVNTSFARFSLAVAITPVFQGEDVCGYAPKKFVNGARLAMLEALP